MPNVPQPAGSSPQKTVRRRVRRKDAMGALDAGVRAGLPGKGKGGGGRGGNEDEPLDDGTPTMDEVRAAVRQKFGPVRQELQRERRVSKQQMGNIDDWYADYVNTVQAATQNQMASNAAAAQGQQDRTNQSFARGLDAAASSAGQQAATARRASADSFGALLASQGASAVNVLGQQQVAGAQSKLGALKDETGRRREIAAKFLDLAREKGDFKSAFVDQARADAHQQRLEEAAFGLDAAKTKADIKNIYADNKNADRDDRRTRNQWKKEPTKYGPTKGEWAKMSPAERKPWIEDFENGADTKDDSKSEDRKERNKEIRNTVADINRYRRKTNSKGEHPTLKDIRDWLREDGVDVDIIDAAIQSLPKKKRKRYKRPGGPVNAVAEIPGIGPIADILP